MANNQSPQLRATGNINTSVFVMIDTANDDCGLQAGSNSKVIGISQEGTDNPPGLTGATNYAAQSGENFKLYGLGAICLLTAGSGGWTRGDLLISDTNGNGITAPTGQVNNIGAVALESAASSGVQARVQVVIFSQTPSSAGALTVSSLTISDGGNIIVGATNGTKVGSNATQKIGFFGATPVAQQSSTGELLGMNGNGATNANAVNMNSNGNLGSTYYDFSDIVKALKNVGIIA